MLGKHFLTMETVYVHMYVIPYVQNNIIYCRNGQKVQIAGMSSQHETKASVLSNFIVTISI